MVCSQESRVSFRAIAGRSHSDKMRRPKIFSLSLVALFAVALNFIQPSNAATLITFYTAGSPACLGTPTKPIVCGLSLSDVPLPRLPFSFPTNRRLNLQMFDFTRRFETPKLLRLSSVTVYQTKNFYPRRPSSSLTAHSTVEPPVTSRPLLGPYLQPATTPVGTALIWVLRRFVI